jgi:poly(A) polymerase
MSITEHMAEPAVHVIERLRHAGYQAFIVGGAVRDLLLGREPKDYDVATSATPEQVKQVFGRRARIIGRRFRLVHVYIGHNIFEVSTFRREPTLDERKGRAEDTGLQVWRDNSFGNEEQDARRRDFTVNAIYYDPLRNGGEVVDYVAGMDDLRAGLVRAIGDPATRMAEDPVRMLRACKLAGEYGFSFEPQLFEAIRSQAQLLQLASRARLLEELYKLFRKPYLYATLHACHQTGLLHHLLPSVAGIWETPVGHQCQRLIHARDSLIADGRCFASRMSGLAALMLPAIIQEFGDGQTVLWENHPGIEGDLQNRLRDFFSNYQLPRYSVAKVRDMFLLLPRLLEGRQRQRALRHPEYGRARDLFLIFVTAEQLPATLLDPWPPARSGRHRQEEDGDDEGAPTGREVAERDDANDAMLAEVDEDTH